MLREDLLYDTQSIYSEPPNPTVDVYKRQVQPWSSGLKIFFFHKMNIFLDKKIILEKLYTSNHFAQKVRESHARG